MYFKILFVFLLFFTFSKVLIASSNKEIIIDGNEMIDDDVIYSIIGNQLNLDNDEEKNRIIKLLYDTGNFKNILIEENEKNYILKITENPKIYNIEFIGNKRFKKEDILEQFKEEKYFKYYNYLKVDQFVSELKTLYMSFGYNQININYQLLENNDDKNSVDIEFDIFEGKISKINKIYFIGNNNSERNELLSEIKSKEHNILRLSGSENFKQFEVNNDIIRLKKYYRNQGFRDIEATYKTEYIDSKNKFNIYFYIIEGDKFLINKIDLNSESLDIESEISKGLRNIVEEYYLKKVTKNNFYKESHLDNLKESLSDYLFNNGQVFFKITVFEKTNEKNIDLLFKIDKAEIQYVDQINIYGNTRTLDKVIRREVSLAEGDAVNSEKIRLTKRNLTKLGLFKSIKIDKIQKDENNVDIDIAIEEQSTGEFNFGLSFGSLQGASFLSGLKEKNLGGLGRELNFTINTSNDATQYSLDLVEPYVFNQKIDFIYGISFTENDFSSSSSFNLTNFNTKTGFDYALTEELDHTITLEYSLKDYEITDSSTASSDVKKRAGNNADIFLNNAIRYNKLNSFIRPTKGTYMSFDNHISPITNSDNGSVKTTIIYKKYHKIDSNILSFQGKVGNIFSLQDDTIPSDEKFSLGGRWLRGFDSFGAGPRDSRTSYIGGNNLLVAKLDFQRPLFKNSDNPIDLNLFSDAGKIFENKEAPTNTEESIRTSVGAGIKFYSPIGPIGLSWAFPISSESYDIERMFLFSVGNLN